MGVPSKQLLLAMLSGYRWLNSQAESPPASPFHPETNRSTVYLARRALVACGVAVDSVSERETHLQEDRTLERSEW